MSYGTMFLIVNVIGGIFVVGGYVVGFSLFSEAKETMWGGINSSHKQIYQISNIFSDITFNFINPVSSFVSLIATSNKSAFPSA